MIQFGRKCEPEDDIQPPPYTTINGLSAWFEEPYIIDNGEEPRSRN
jgi:hypothetical protein